MATKKTTPTHRRCPGCRQTVLTGPEDGVGPHTVTLDAAALTPEGEYLALTHGHRTYSHNQGFPLTRRDAWAIETVNPEPPQRYGGYTVHATHWCGDPDFPHYPPIKKPRKVKAERPPY